MKKIAIVLSIIGAVLLITSMLFQIKTNNKDQYYECIRNSTGATNLKTYAIEKIQYNKKKEITQLDVSIVYEISDDTQYDLLKKSFNNCEDTYKKDGKVICPMDSEPLKAIGRNVEEFVDGIKDSFKCELRDK